MGNSQKTILKKIIVIEMEVTCFHLGNKLAKPEVQGLLLPNL